MTTAMIAFTAMVLSMYLLPAEGGKVCQIRGPGKLTQFNGKRVNIQIPCKFDASTVFCEGYRLHVSPGVYLDKKNRYYVRSMWVQIKKVDTDFLWAGRTGDLRLERIFNGKNKPLFNVKINQLDGAPFSIVTESNATDRRVTLSASDASWKIQFYGYDPKNRALRKGNGVKIICSSPQYDPAYDYPVTLCGNLTDVTSIGKFKRAIPLSNRKLAVMYNVLDNMGDVAQTSDLCVSAGNVFDTCTDADRIQALEKCSPLLGNRKILRYMISFNLQPMQEFLNCLRYKCNDDLTSCETLQYHMASSDDFSITCN